MIVRLLLALAATLGGSIAASSPVTAQQRSLVLARFDAAITVRPTGELEITETIAARFTGVWNGIYRSIPVEYRTPSGFNWRIRLDLQSITNQDGEPLSYESSRERHYRKFKIWVPNAEDATRTVVIKYLVHGGLRFFDEHDELYWNITGDEWDVPIEAASARITLPHGASGIRATAFNGVYGATGRDAVVETRANQIRVTMPTALGFREGLTAVVGWDKGLVPEPTGTDRALAFLAANWPLLIPIPIFIAMLLTWRARGRDPAKLPVSVQYTAPEGLSPAEAGTLIDNRVDMRDITATMVDLAVNGHLRIEERKESKVFGLFERDDFVFHRLRTEGDRPGLRPHESRVLSGIFGGGESSVALSSLQNKFYSSLPGIRQSVYTELVRKKYYQRRPDSVQALWIGVGVIVGGLLAIVGSMISAAFDLTPVPFLIAGAISGIIIVGFGMVVPARTVAGARALERVLGFEEFLERVESDRLDRVGRTPELFERCLPYAMAFGVEKQWAKAFRDIYREPPTWYAGRSFTTFDAAAFSSRLSAMSSQAASTMSSSPRSSSGSGFSGGSSGGGGGGGGGGGF